MLPFIAVNDFDFSTAGSGLMLSHDKPELGGSRVGKTLAMKGLPGEQQCQTGLQTLADPLAYLENELVKLHLNKTLAMKGLPARMRSVRSRSSMIFSNGCLPGEQQCQTVALLSPVARPL